MNYYIWTEGNREMGFGHVYRTLTLAEELPSLPQFITTSGSKVIEKIRAGGFSVESAENANEALKLIGDRPRGTVILDRLDVEPSWASEIKNNGHRVVIFDNLSRANERADVVVRVVGSDFRNSSWIEDTGAKFFIGPRYYILKRSFFERRKEELKAEEGRILVLFGGTDPRDLSGPIFRELATMNETRRIDLVLGAGNRNVAQLAVDVRKAPDGVRAELHRDIKDVSVLMAKASLVITSPGLSMFESLFLGKKVIAFSQTPFHDAVFGGRFHLLHSEDVPRLKDIIKAGEWIDPTDEGIVIMQIGEGKGDVMKAIIDLSVA